MCRCLKFCTYLPMLGTPQECCCGVMRLHSQKLGVKRFDYFFFFPKTEKEEIC